MSVKAMNRAVRGWAVVASAAVLAVAGCGSSSDAGSGSVSGSGSAAGSASTSGSGSGSAASASASGAADGSGQSASSGDGGGDCGNTLKVGILTDFTGELGDFGKTSKEGFQFAAKQVKESGELPKGWSIKTVQGDGQTDPQEALRIATSMVQGEEVSAILGPSSGEIMAMVKLSERYKTPIISQFAGTVNLDSVGGKWLYRTVASDSSDGLAAAKWLSDQGAKNVVILVQNDESTVSAAKMMENTFTEGGGTATTVKYNAGQPSYQTVVQQAIDAHPDAIFLSGGQESGVTIMKELLDAGFPSDKVLASADMAVPAVIKAIGAGQAEGMQAETPAGDNDRPQYQAFTKAFEAELGHKPDLFVSNAYDAMTLVALAAVAADSTCGADINAHLRDVANAPGKKVDTFADGAKALAAGEDIDYEGASGPVDFDETGTVAGSYAILKVADGKWTQATFYPADVFTAGS